MYLAILFSLALIQPDASEKQLISSVVVHCESHTIPHLPDSAVEEWVANNSVPPYIVNFHEAHVFYENQEYDSAFEALNNVLVYHTDIDGRTRFLSLLLKGEVSFTQKKILDASLITYKEAYSIGTNESIFFDLTSRINAVIGDIYMRKLQYDSSLFFLKKWERNYKQFDTSERQKRELHNMGLSYFHLKKFDSAELYLKQSLVIEKQLKDTLGLAISFMDFGNLYYEQYKDDLAIPYFEKGLKYAIISGDLNVMRSAYLNMAVVEENRKNFSASLKLRKQYEFLVDSIWNRDRVWEIAEMENKFKIDLKNNELKTLQEKQKLQEAEAEIQSLRLNAFIATTALFLIVSSIIFWFFRNVRLKNKVISNQKETLEALVSMKNRLFSIIAHDLKSPLISLKRSQSQLSKAVKNGRNDQIESVVENNKSTVDRTFNLLDNLLHWALDQSHEILFQRQEYNLKLLVEMVVYDYNALLKSKNITLTMDIPDSIEVQIDVNTMKVVLRNLLDNAIKFTSENGSININAQNDSNTVRMSIEDSGVGIRPENIPGLFQLNSEKSQADTSGNRSTGLGLMLCKSFMEKNDGSISVKSEVGVGTRFILELPLIAELTT